MTAVSIREIFAQSPEELAREFDSLNVDKKGVNIMIPKGLFHVLRLRNLKSPAANILKQEMLSIGGECATSRSVILGDPGSGKTTHLKRVFLWCLHGGLEKLGLPAGMIPVFLPLRELQNLEAGLDAFIQEELDKPYLDTPEGFGKDLLKRGNLLFLFDGLDEISDTTQRVKVSRWINDAILGT